MSSKKTATESSIELAKKLRQYSVDQLDRSKKMQAYVKKQTGTDYVPAFLSDEQQTHEINIASIDLSLNIFNEMKTVAKTLAKKIKASRATKASEVQQ